MHTLQAARPGRQGCSGHHADICVRILSWAYDWPALIKAASDACGRAVFCDVIESICNIFEVPKLGDRTKEAVSAFMPSMPIWHMMVLPWVAESAAFQCLLCEYTLSPIQIPLAGTLGSGIWPTGLCRQSWRLRPACPTGHIMVLPWASATFQTMQS